MINKFIIPSASILAAIFSIVTISEAQTMTNRGLNAKQEKIIAISAFTANGNLQKLKTALSDGLDAGLTVSADEILGRVLGEKKAAASPGSAADEVDPQAIRITRSGSHWSAKGPEEYFTGSVHVTMLVNPTAPSRTSVGRVTFEPGARTAWHAHPFGQTLIVTEGVGRIQRWGGKVEEIRPGDVAWIPPGTKHWHGASPGSAMTHLAIQEHLDGKAAEWMEKVGVVALRMNETLKRARGYAAMDGTTAENHLKSDGGDK